MRRPDPDATSDDESYESEDESDESDESIVHVGEINEKQLVLPHARDLLMLTLHNNEGKVESALKEIKWYEPIWTRTLVTALRVAARFRLEESMRALIRFFVENPVIDFDPKEVESVLETSVNNRDWAMAKALIRIGERRHGGAFGDIIRRRQRQLGGDILAHATLHKHEYSSTQEDVIRSLLDSGADCDCPCVGGDGYPLGNAVQAGSDYIVESLIKRGAGHNVPYKGCRTPHDIALIRYKEAKALLKIVSVEPEVKPGKRRRQK